MKIFNLNMLPVEELDSNQMREKNGGSFIATAICTFLAIEAVGIILLAVEMMREPTHPRPYVPIPMHLLRPAPPRAQGG